MRYWILIVALAFGYIMPLQASSKNALDQLALLGGQLIGSYNATEQPDRPLAERIANFIATGSDTGKIVSEEKGKIKSVGAKKYGLRKTPANRNEKTQLMLQIGRLAYLSYSDVSGILDASINGILTQAIKTNQKGSARKHAYLVFLAYDFMKSALGGVFLPISEKLFVTRLTEKIKKDSKGLKSGFGKLKDQERIRYINYLKGLDLALKEVTTLAINGGNIPKQPHVSDKDLASLPVDVPDDLTMSIPVPPPPPMDDLGAGDKAKKQLRKVIRHYKAASGLRVGVEDMLREKIARLRARKKAEALAAKGPSNPILSLDGIEGGVSRLRKVGPPKPSTTQEKDVKAGAGGGLKAALQQSLARYRKFVQDDESDDGPDPEWD